MTRSGAVRRLAIAVAVGLAVLATSTAPVASQEVYDVRGVVADSTGAGLQGAMVVALALPDSVLTKFALSDGNGRFTLTRVPPGEYLLQVTMVGHQLVRQPFVLTTDHLDAGTVQMSVLAVEMDELVVSVDHVPFVNRRDTLDYNANAFITRPNATVEELLARLPGIEVDDDGTIRAQGEEVQNVLVDGKEFFGADPTIATRNLPADAVERVQVYDKESDMAEFTGIADGEEERTINLELRDEARTGYFGQVQGGLGGGLQPTSVIDQQPSGRTRYAEAVRINRFSPSTQLALLGGANNVNQAAFSWGDFVSGRNGGGRDFGGGRNSGFTETLSLGMNANHDFTEDRWIRSSYYFTSLDNSQRQTSQQQQLLGSSVAALQSSNDDQVTDNKTHRLNLNAQYDFSEGHDVRLRSDLSFGSSLSTGLQSSSTTTLAGQLRNSAASTNVVDSNDFGGNASLTWRKRLSETGRALVGTASVRISDPERLSDLETTTQLADAQGNITVEDVLQEQSRTGRTLNMTQRLSLTQPVWGATFEVFGEHRAVDEDQDVSVYDLVDESRILNSRLSSGFERAYSYLEGGFRFNRSGEKGRVVLGLEVQSSNLEGTIRDRDETIENAYTHVLPSADFRLQINDAKTLNLRYRTSTREPSMTQLQPWIDNTNPVRTYVGNPNLTPEYSHSLNADYRFFDQFSFVNLFTYLRFSFTQDDIINSRSYDEQARQTITPINIDHSWSMNGGATYGRPIRPIGAKINLNYSFNHTRGTELLNDLENNSRIWRNSIDASIDNRDKEFFDIRAGARFSINDVAYTLNTELNQQYMDKTFYGNGMVHWGQGWTLAGQFNYRLYDEDVFGEADRNVAMLNASISRMAMDDRVEVELVAFDLLDQNKNVSYENGASFIGESRTESLGRYLMLRVNYRLGALSGFGHGRGGMDRMHR